MCGLNINTLAEAPLLDEQVLSGQDMLSYVESAVYAELVETLDPEMFYVEDVSTAYLSKEYLEELAYNSKANIFFGYNLDDLNAMFQGTRYVFTLDESGQTGVPYRLSSSAKSLGTALDSLDILPAPAAFFIIPMTIFQ